jgi:hypothetical protein
VPVVSDGTYLKDVRVAAGDLQRRGGVLGRAKDVSQLKRQRKVLRTALRNFDRRIYAMSRYRLDTGGLNRQRSRLAATGSRLSVSLSDFTDYVLLDNLAQVQRLVGVLGRRIAAFQGAATG